MVIYSMIDYLKSTHELSPNLTITVSVNGKPRCSPGRFGSVEPFSESAPDLTLNESSLQTGANHIKITSTGAGRAYFGARAEYNSLELPATSSALKLTREYFRLVPVKTGDKIVYDTVPLEGSVAPGDTLAVRLSLTGSSGKYMIIEDPIPAGTEFIEKDNLYQLRAAPPWWQWYFDRREMHDDHMAIFQTWLQGNREYFYLLKVVNPGVFQVNPAKAGPMYQTRCHGDRRRLLLESEGWSKVMRWMTILHLTANALLLTAGYYWLGIGESRTATLLWSIFLALFCVLFACCAYSASLAYMNLRGIGKAWSSWPAQSLYRSLLAAALIAALDFCR